MEPIFNPENIVHKIAIGNLFFIALAQFFVIPFLGHKIYNRCKEIGYGMKSRPFFIILNTSNLWREAREFNKNQNDEMIKKALKIYRLSWIYAILSMIFAFIVI